MIYRSAALYGCQFYHYITIPAPLDTLDPKYQACRHNRDYMPADNASVNHGKGRYLNICALVFYPSIIQVISGLCIIISCDVLKYVQLL
jgi:hypothetical protein